MRIKILQCTLGRILGLILIILNVAGCREKAHLDSSRLYIAISSSPVSLDPRRSTDAYGARIVNLIYQSLVRADKDLNIVPNAATEWEYKPLQFRFHLKPDLQFANGRKVTGADLQFSFEQFTHESSPFRSSLQEIKSLETKTHGDHLDVILHLKRFSAKLLGSDLSSLKILPAKEMKAHPEDLTLWPGTGSFRLTSANDREIVLTRRTDTPDLVKHLVFQIIRDDLTRYQKLLKGEIDVAQAEIPASKVDVFRGPNSGYEVYQYPGLSANYVLLNLKVPQLQNKEVRRALAEAINRPDIIRYKLNNMARPATGIMPAALSFFDESLKPIAYRPESARQRLSQLGESIKLTLKTANNPQTLDVAKVMLHDWRKAGFDINLKSFEWGTYYGDLSKGHFELALMRWVGVLDPDIYRVALHSKEVPPGRNRGYFDHKKFDDLVERGLSIADKKLRILHYYEVQKLVLEELPIIPLWYEDQVAIVHRRVQGYQPSRNGDYSTLAFVKKLGGTPDDNSDR